MKKVILSMTCAFLMIGMPVLAAPSVNGPTGLINSPTADVLRLGQFSLGYYQMKDGGVSTFNTNLAPNIEVGVSTFHYESQQNKNYLHVKFALRPEQILTPGIALGVEGIGSHDKPSLYGVVSKALPFGFRIHAGLGNGRFSGLFASIEKTINPRSIRGSSQSFPVTTLIAEYDGKNMNYGARLTLSPGLKLDVGLRNHDGYVGLHFTN